MAAGRGDHAHAADPSATPARDGGLVTRRRQGGDVDLHVWAVLVIEPEIARKIHGQKLAAGNAATARADNDRSPQSRVDGQAGAAVAPELGHLGGRYRGGAGT